MHTARSLCLALLSIITVACQARDQQVGSACSDGACPNATAVQSGLACLVSGSVQVVTLPEGVTIPGLCLARPIPTDEDGLVDCRLRWRPTPSSADDVWYDDPQPCDSESAQLPGSQCVVRQLSHADRDEGTALGWFYTSTEGCARVELTAGAVPPGGEAHLECAVALTRDEDGKVHAVDPGLCAQGEAADPDRVGDACLPRSIPEGGFDSREAHLETPSAQCGSDVCLVYQLDGDPSPGCAPPAHCAVEQDIADSVYCSMRCSVPGGPGDAGSPVRDCPDGFACVEVLSRGPEGLVGGYCVRSPRGTASASVGPATASGEAGSN